MPKAKFQMKHVVATPGELEAIKDAQQSSLSFLSRHAQGDWGDVSQPDADLDDEALKDGSRLLSSYTTRKGTTLWIISDATNDSDIRDVTTVLLPEEY